MPMILIISSQVAASRVGGGAQALALARLGIEPILVPTVLFGRHPGHGPPGGRAVDPDIMQAMLEGIEAQGVFEQLDGVITGHFSLPEQVDLAGAVLDTIRAANPGAAFFVDPVMGDESSGLYIKEAVAEALVKSLLPRADVIAPNVWELAQLSGCQITDPASAAFACRVVRKPVIVSSVPAGDGAIGVVYADAASAILASHARAAAAPNGTGDLLTALFAAGLMLDLDAPGALAGAVSGVADAVAAAQGAAELSVAAFPAVLGFSNAITLASLDG